MVEKMYRKILLAVDSSETSKRAAKRALQLQKASNAKVIAFYSIEHHMIPQQFPFVPMETPQYEVPISVYEEVEETYIQHGKEILADTEEMFQNEDVSIETRLIKDKPPQKYIIHTVKNEEVDLVILGDKGEHSKIKEVFLGSVTESVIHHAECDILIVR